MIKECLAISMATFVDFGRLGMYLKVTYCTDHRGTPEEPGRVVTVIERQFWETLNDPVRPPSQTSILTSSANPAPETPMLGPNKAKPCRAHETHTLQQLAHLEYTPESTSRVWGAAYRIPASHAEEVHDYLDEREIDGYSVHYTPFHPFLIDSASPAASKPITCMVYIGQPTNPQFLRDPARREPQDVATVISRGHGQSGKNIEYLYLLEKALEGLGLGSADGHVTDLVRRVKAIESADEAAADEEAAARDLEKSLSRSEEEAHQNFMTE
ncbi:hypothetical protein FE257_000505 [Aspergillus nanangensis]|uniref:glutathione-specific gamma-glutamylcyclotransferase n=1 Tax=Aspergillus nanangensis TaxID=2582783 RepID=A0AAD4CUX7_ASPNN|nr:hypothetical protein FE257_000505 [Aspergillus nanangensis]